jgi:hypothetical protein
MPDDRQIRIDQQDARQGRTGVGLRYVLVGSLVLVILAFIIVGIVVR